MPLSERGVLNLKVVNAEDGVDLLCLKWPAGAGSRWYLAIPLRTCSVGIILALPSKTLSAEILEEAEDAGGDGLVGPSQVVTVGVHETAVDGELLEVQMVEFGMGIHRQLEKRTPRSRRAIVGFAEDVSSLPNLSELNILVESWLDGGDLRLEEYWTAAEEPVAEVAAPTSNDAVLQHLQDLKDSLDQRFVGIEAAVRKLETKQPAARELQSRAPLDGFGQRSASSGEPNVESILAQARTHVKRPPRRTLDEPERGGETAVDVDRMAQHGSEAPSVDEMMKLALVRLLEDRSGKTKKKAKKLPGLESWEESESSGEEASSWSASSKGGRGIAAVERLWGAMRNHPEAYQERMEQRMLKAVEATEMTPNIPLLYAKSVPVGKSRTAGYCLQGFAQVHRLLLENKPKQARLQVLRMEAALEQFLIDESWVVAGRLTGMEEPPWGHWATQDVSALRKQYVYTRLAESTWVAALINELKEEEWLVKKRAALGKPKGKGEGKDAGGKETGA
ncbi:METAP1D [Symbiodinium natans]|uniref:METAP1D protein n=1 Tax=Symbiodinium natans TaxID=878477 RepID=A0A812RNK3_9DINO|nr:METAP1D [Symbiodinium natans]